ncbi:hypothetical protein [Haladaptatus cibarius]|uniref:hypothetical protein n=1 Tax=Haladaptatus cibarius TaxID=453847 RepID=UPI000678819B|nr:hypothetical protein [Haladaptatus cibarius]
MDVCDRAEQVSDDADDLTENLFWVVGVDVEAFRTRFCTLHVQLRCVFVHEVGSVQVVNERGEIRKFPTSEIEELSCLY